MSGRDRKRGLVGEMRRPGGNETKMVLPLRGEGIESRNSPAPSSSTCQGPAVFDSDSRVII